jgi:hypothetical protein
MKKTLRWSPVDLIRSHSGLAVFETGISMLSNKGRVGWRGFFGMVQSSIPEEVKGRPPVLVSRAAQVRCGSIAPL